MEESKAVAYIKQKADARRYWVRNAQCLGAECLALGLFQHRGAIGAAGTRNTGAVSPTCMTNAYRGCPSCVKYSKELATKRRKEGLKVASP
jgi:hypothetical protein